MRLHTIGTGCGVAIAVGQVLVYRRFSKPVVVEVIKSVVSQPSIQAAKLRQVKPVVLTVVDADENAHPASRLRRCSTESWSNTSVAEGRKRPLYIDVSYDPTGR
jgi:hypothetical protein